MALYLPKGTRDFLPEQMRKRQAVIDTVRGVFDTFGFEPLETPAFERLETLTGKYGDEGEKLMYRILKRGEGGRRGECDLGLRYDLTVPLTRVISLNPGLPMPFKRWQIQPVWRADRPQKGRFREFYQCDVDTIGCAEMSADAECLAVAQAALRELGFREFTIRLNDRGILRAFAEAANAIEQEMSVIIAIDKLDKIGWDGVKKELLGRGVSEVGCDTIGELLECDLDQLEARLPEVGRQGVARLREVLDFAEAFGVDPDVILVDPTLARGADYYTGPVFEIAVTEPKIGSIGGGGRYDDLIGLGGKETKPAVGISLGLERIIVVMDELGMFDDAVGGLDVLVTVFGEETRKQSMRVATALRDAGLSTRVELGLPKLKKQFKEANRLGAHFLIVIGPREAEAGLLSLKNLRTGEQVSVDLAGALAVIRG